MERGEAKKEAEEERKKKCFRLRHLANRFLLLLSISRNQLSPDRSRVERDLQAAVALALFVGVDAAASVRLRLAAAIHSATKAAPAAAAAAAAACMPPSRGSRSSAAATEASAGACAWLVPRDDLL